MVGRDRWSVTRDRGTIARDRPSVTRDAAKVVGERARSGRPRLVSARSILHPRDGTRAAVPRLNRGSGDGPVTLAIRSSKSDPTTGRPIVAGAGTPPLTVSALSLARRAAQPERDDERGDRRDRSADERRGRRDARVKRA